MLTILATLNRTMPDRDWIISKRLAFNPVIPAIQAKVFGVANHFITKPFGNTYYRTILRR